MMISWVSILQHELTARWVSDGTATPPVSTTNFDDLIAAQHFYNYTLWQLEDSARTPGLPDSDLAECKRRIDKTNQLRNDHTELIDERLYLDLVDAMSKTASLHSESPGLMIDRLSILSLKVFYTGVEAQRRNAGDDHHTKAAARLRVLHEQRSDLTACLDQLINDVCVGVKRFKTYRQLKMYNDPEMNPAIYGVKR